MLCVAAGVADRVPAFDLTQVRPSRAHTERGEAVSVLLWLDSDPEHADKSPIVWPEFARDAISYPDRAGSVWQQRGEALLSLSASGSVDMAVCNALDARMGEADWAGALAWLDGLTAGERRLSVVR
ncbi:hypothetical protein [Nocardia sp. CY41]|uniref:hypothetical protein n=1 Tax=Nocardia sp. CY41 TaxID=2608686 RepID=UPI00135BDDD1|nr:hypothetical protein [Nocardia sp. CY41]